MFPHAMKFLERFNVLTLEAQAEALLQIRQVAKHVRRHPKFNNVILTDPSSIQGCLGILWDFF